MKTTFLRTAKNSAKLLPLCGALAAAIFLPGNVRADPAKVGLGTAADFAVLAGSGITVAGAVNSTTITGDIGTFSTPTITGLGNVVLNGANHAGDAITQHAKIDLLTAYNDAAGRTFDTSYAGGFDLAGLTLHSGVYRDSSSLFLSGTLTLDAQGNPDAVWIFQTGSTFISASNSLVSLIGGADACNVFWQVGSSATLGTNTGFSGDILALESITLNTGATVDGRALALNGAVTLDNNTVIRTDCANGGTGGNTSVPDGGSVLLLLSSGLGAMFAFGRYSAARIKHSAA